VRCMPAGSAGDTTSSCEGLGLGGSAELVPAVATGLLASGAPAGTLPVLLLLAVLLLSTAELLRCGGS
jgi:hypothetical protein